MIPANQHVVLVGLMGTGKTTVGRALAERLHRRLLDSDLLIEARTGRTVRQIFQDEGEPAFRALETEVLIEALAQTTPSVIAAAGGVVLSEQNRRALKAAPAKVVWLRAEPDRCASAWLMQITPHRRIANTSHHSRSSRSTSTPVTDAYARSLSDNESSDPLTCAIT